MNETLPLRRIQPYVEKEELSGDLREKKMAKMEKEIRWFKWQIFCQCVCDIIFAACVCL